MTRSTSRALTPGKRATGRPVRKYCAAALSHTVADGEPGRRDGNGVLDESRSRFVVRIDRVIVNAQRSAPVEVCSCSTAGDLARPPRNGSGTKAVDAWRNCTSNRAMCRPPAPGINYPNAHPARASNVMSMCRHDRVGQPRKFSGNDNAARRRRRSSQGIADRRFPLRITLQRSACGTCRRDRRCPWPSACPCRTGAISRTLQP